ncbi:hypothetical protein RQM47_10770 [Rubrivirga sp. S365]|uniref:DUF4189 domain-containing protein n=1 Tax=Rubrivirga litoralis TaxID=3075598 RepID=A0ABU3BUT4_9BACT|nr:MULTISPECIES: hypothetical protein [unclassified Rubrivirga]MDT0633056.1 hypothetical protein [Rubrivirga sp. F394]MDT7857123.1 hypothetical protein [Rubrivirga sp. S365]
MRLLVLAAALLAVPVAAQDGGAPGRAPLPPDSVLTRDGPPLTLLMSRGGYSVVGPAAGGTGLWVTAVQRGGTVFTPCGSVAEQWAGGDAWTPVDTLDCEAPPMPSLNASAAEVAVAQIHLNPDFLQRLVAANGRGNFRMVYLATDSRGRPLPDTLRATPPFVLVDFASVHAEAVEALRARPGWRALAVGRRENHRYFWGASWSYGSAAAAANRALDECRERATGEGDSPCWVERVEAPVTPGSD